MSFGLLLWWRGRARVVRAMRAAPADCPHGVLLGIEGKTNLVGVVKCVDCGTTIEIAWAKPLSTYEEEVDLLLAAGGP